MTVKRNKAAASYSIFKNLNADIYEDLWFTAKDAQESGKKIDKPLWERELDTKRENDRCASYTPFVNGHKGVKDGSKFTIIWKNGDDPIRIMPFRVIVDVDSTNLSRAHLAAVLHRLSEYIIKVETKEAGSTPSA